MFENILKTLYTLFQITFPMNIKRDSKEPPYCEYALRYAIVPTTLSLKDSQSVLPETVSDLAEPIEIPTFQRSIVWRKDQVKELVDSKSALYGTVILAKSVDRPLSLIDGLQRFATATAFLVCLYARVISPDPTDETASRYFTKLKLFIQKRQPVVAHNDKMLKGDYNRKSINDSYKDLLEDIESFVDDELKKDPKEFADKIQSMLLDKQIGIDSYSNFENSKELTNTFITMNSTGLDLSPVDLLRARLVDQTILQKWLADDIEDMENRFTETFEPGNLKTHLKVLGNALNEEITDNPNNIFPQWDAFTKKHIDELLDFIDNVITNAKNIKEHPYLSEIIACGGLPFTIVILFFYKYHFLKKEIPDFAGGELNTQYDCRVLLQSFYRRLIDGSIGRLGPEVEGVLKGKLRSITDLASQINPSSAGLFGKAPNLSWLDQRLREADIVKSKRIFNVCLLPDRKNTSHDFVPRVYGTSEGTWAIDHLIPKKKLIPNQKGEREINRLPNFAQLTSDKNREAKNLPCSDKLRSHSIYAGIHRNVHPYIDWLITEHLPKYDKAKDVEINKNEFLHPLDAQLCLQPNAKPSIGDERIAAIAKIISTKI